MRWTEEREGEGKCFVEVVHGAFLASGRQVRVCRSCLDIDPKYTSWIHVVILTGFRFVYVQ